MKVLTKYHQPLFATIAAGVITIDRSTPFYSGGWTQPVPGVLVSETYFDLKGLAIEDETIFFDGMAVQESGVPAIQGTAGDNYMLFDFMTTIPLDQNAINAVITVAPGFPGSTLNYEHVPYARYRRWAIDLDTAARMAMVVNDSQAGSLAPTASDRLYCYRIVIVDAATLASATSINTQAARYVIDATPKAEPEYQYLMRLKKSYDLQQTPDVD